jgi:hypothetical protein
MSFNPYGYTDPYEASRGQQAFPLLPPSSTPLQPSLPVGPAGPFTAPLPVVQDGPLAGLQDQLAGVLNTADSHHVYVPGPGGTMLTYPRGRQPSVARDMAYGAAAGFGAWLVWRQMKRRKAIKNEYTTPTARFFLIWWAFMVAGFALSMMWPMEADWFLGIAFVSGTVLSLAYLAYRIAGGGRYNTNRSGSPWRDDHRTEAHRSR